MKKPQLPLLPGFNFDQNIGRTHFGKPIHFDLFKSLGNRNINYVRERPSTTRPSRYPVLYAWGEEPKIPPWIAFDGQRLKFKAYFQEGAYEREPYRIRQVNISFFLEDGTMKISEPKFERMCTEVHGILVKRQRIPLSDPVKYRYYDILDLNIGAEPEIYGRVYKIYDCDEFTRRFLNRMGIPVPDPLDCPADPYREKLKDLQQRAPNRTKSEPAATSLRCRREEAGKFFKYDRKVLRFYGYWDDSESYQGFVHDLEILYHLATDRIEVIDIVTLPGDRPRRVQLIKPMRIPKFFMDLEPVGSGDPLTILNIFGENEVYYIKDGAYDSRPSADYYRDCDLTIGAQINVFGRKIVITAVDENTKEFYRKKYGLEDFAALPHPENKGHAAHHQQRQAQRCIPPYNGFGSYEDSLSNYLHLVPKRPHTAYDKLFRYEDQEPDTRVIRFGARMISDLPLNRDRLFVVCLYLATRTISVFEVARGGQTKGVFLNRVRPPLPGQNKFSAEPLRYYGPEDFYIGNTVNFYDTKFLLESADEHTFKYMEQHCDEFPKSNSNAIMERIRPRLKESYKEFLETYSQTVSDDDKEKPLLSFDCFREAIEKYAGDCVTEHEIITLARHFNVQEHKDLRPRDYIRALVHWEVTRNVWNQLDRLEEDFRDRDRKHIGYLPRNDVYCILRANRVPGPPELLNLMLDKTFKDDEGRIDWRDVLMFMNTKINPLPPVVPVNIQVLYWLSEEQPKECRFVDWNAFVEDLKLGEGVVSTSHSPQN